MTRATVPSGNVDSRSRSAFLLSISNFRDSAMRDSVSASCRCSERNAWSAVSEG